MTRPKERGILFSAAMVRAILDGRKTVTRRIVRPQGPTDAAVRKRCGGGYHYFTDHHARSPAHFRVAGPVSLVRDLGGPTELVSPYGARGDRLWVRETWRPCTGIVACLDSDSADVVVRYAADGSTLYYSESQIPDGWTMPKSAARGMVTPLHMPRWASRLVLEIVDVRIERLQAISEEDAAREGVDPVTPPGAAVILDRPSAKSHRYAFAMLWLDLHGENAPWDTNPWVWRVEFKTHFSRRGTA